MTTIDLPFARDLHARLLPLTEPLHEAFAFAHSEVRKHLPTYRNAGRLAHLQSALIRAAVRESLSFTELGDWRLEGDPNLMGQLRFDHADGQVRLRMLKATRPSRVPHAGSNTARRAFWRNQPMLDFEQLELEVPTCHNLLLLWSPSEDGVYDLKVARPLVPGRFRGTVSTDFMMDLAPTRTLFEMLEFPGEDYEDEDLFETEVEEEIEDGSGAG
ncbi:hypothetical protein [Sinomonas susongensis]|uniref:hypothetical protein n=1 Tax=Sinomonas susongensis TaxID=1324851 RepID=UPI001109DE26|nr:hypothetical protein [Sinomonas susongensis]